jgi:IS1 family transposase
MRSPTRNSTDSGRQFVAKTWPTSRIDASSWSTVLRGVKAKRVQAHAIWSFCYAKQKNVSTGEGAPEIAGDVWTWTAVDADSNLIVSYLIGGRDAGYAHELLQDVASRLANRVQLTTEGQRAYLDAIDGDFGADLDHAQLVKLYGSASENARRRYNPAECTGMRKTRVEGRPAPALVGTSYIECQNLALRKHFRRFTQLTNGFSRKAMNHAHMVALYAYWFNFVRIHKTLCVTPAMSAGLTDRLWSMEDVVAMIEAR